MDEADRADRVPGRLVPFLYSVPGRWPSCLTSPVPPKLCEAQASPKPPRRDCKMTVSLPQAPPANTSTGTDSPSQPTSRPRDCLSCRVIGTGALGATGLYAINQGRAHQPGSVVGKRIMAGVGVLFLFGSVVRWRA